MARHHRSNGIGAASVYESMTTQRSAHGSYKGSRLVILTEKFEVVQWCNYDSMLFFLDILLKI